MKIVCQSCGAKYAIADDKVKGKVFKIRCKKCNEAIVVKGTDDESGAQGPMGPPEVEEENEAATKVFDYSSYTVGGGGDPNAVWHVVVEGEQRGPFTMDQLRHFQEAGTVTAETYVWREGFGEWKPIRDVPDFGKPGAVVPMATSFAPAAAESLFAAEPNPLPGDGLFDNAAPSGGGLFDAGGGGLFGGGGGSAAKQDSPFSAGGGLFSSSPATNQADVFSSAGASSGKDDLFKGLDTPGPGFGGPEAMTGARNESSVLFSLSNLQALASSPQPTVKAGGGAVAAVPSSSEASGLIDIRSLAGALSDDGKKESSMDDFMSFGGGGFAPALGAPVLTATRGGGISTGLLVGLIVGGVVLLAALVVGGISLFDDSDKEPSADVALLLAKIEKLEKSGASEEEKAKAREELASARTGDAEPSATTPKGDTPEKPKADATAKKDDKPTKADGERTAAARKQADGGAKTTRASAGSESPASSGSAPAASSGTGKGGKASSELDELLGGGGGAAAAKKPAASKPEPSGGGGGGSGMLTREQVQAGLNGVAPAVKRCAQGQTGTITVQVVISPAGRVSSATPTGSFAGTPIGSCAARAAQGARFPKSSKELTVRFPFKL